jgi:hypothetical protein
MLLRVIGTNIALQPFLFRAPSSSCRLEICAYQENVVVVRPIVSRPTHLLFYGCFISLTFVHLLSTDMFCRLEQHFALLIPSAAAILCPLPGCISECDSFK